MSGSTGSRAHSSRIVPADDAGVVRRAAGDDHDAAQVLHLELGHPEALQHERAVAHAVADRLAHGLRLLVDLLEHVRLVAALLRALLVPVDLDHVGRVVRAGGLVEDRALRRELDDVAVLGELHEAGLREERGNRRREEHLALADADDERRLTACADEQVGMVVMDDDEGEVAFELRVRLLHRGDEVAVVVALDEMHDDFGVGLRGKRVSVVEQRLAQLAVVLDDPVQHDRDLVLVAAGQRMRVLLGHAAVRRPARVPEAVRRLGSVRAGGRLQDLQVADGAHVLEPVGFTQREARGVVAAVLQLLEALQQQRLRVPTPDISDDPAHMSPLCVRRNVSENAREPGRYGLPSLETSAELTSYKRGDGTTQLFGLGLRFGLGQQAHHGLRARAAHEHAGAAVEALVEP